MTILVNNLQALLIVFARLQEGYLPNVKKHKTKEVPRSARLLALKNVVNMDSLSQAGNGYPMVFEHHFINHVF